MTRREQASRNTPAGGSHHEKELILHSADGCADNDSDRDGLRRGARLYRGVPLRRAGVCPSRRFGHEAVADSFRAGHTGQSDPGGSQQSVAFFRLEFIIQVQQQEKKR